MNDKEFLEGETKCPVYGFDFPASWCEECNIGTDGTAVCPFRQKPYQEETK